MKKKRGWFYPLVFVLAVVEVFSVLPKRPPANEDAPKPAGFRIGFIHMHSVFSDGGGTIEEIATAAKKAGGDFVVVTDHNSILARAEYEKQVNGVDVFIEAEGTVPAGHLISFLSHTPYRSFDSSKSVTAGWEHFDSDSRAYPEIFNIIAHPSNLRTPWNRFDRVAEGIEVINFDSAWQRQLSESFSGFTLTMLVSTLNPYLGALRFFQPYPKDLLNWDNVNAFGKYHFGILGHDAHERLKLSPRISLAWPTYLYNFKLASNVVLLDQVPEDFRARQTAIYSALSRGRLAMIFHAIWPFQGNSWEMKCGATTYRSGDEPRAAENCDFELSLPAEFPYPAYARVLKDGEPWREIPFAAGRVKIPVSAGSGVYRAEVWVKVRTLFRLLLRRDVPYILYNPIIVR